MLQLHLLRIIDICFEERALQACLHRFIKQFKVCKDQVKRIMLPEVQGRSKSYRSLRRSESKIPVIQFNGSIRIIISPGYTQKIIGIDNNIFE